jgi:hypothetical protein
VDAPLTIEVDAPPEPTERRPRVGAVLRPLVILALTTAGMWALCAVALVIYTDGARAPEVHELEIPAGTSALIAAGENPLEIPSTWSFLADDTLRLVNRDRVDHWIGSFHVAPNETVEYQLTTTIGGSLFCTIHPSQAIEIEVDARDFDWRLTLAPTFAFGPLVGLVIVGVGRVLRHLDEPEPPSVPSPLQGESHEH